MYTHACTLEKCRGGGHLELIGVKQNLACIFAYLHFVLIPKYVKITVLY